MTYPAAMVQVLERQLDAALLGVYLSGTYAEQLVLCHRVKRLEKQILDWERLDKKEQS